MKKSIIIGASGVLAKSFIKTYPDENYICLDIDKPHSFENEVELNEFNFDISNEDSRNELVKYCRDNKVEIESIIFFQGVNYMSDFFSVTSKKWDTTMEINLKSILFMLKNLFSFIKDKCSIVVIASQNGIVAHEKRLDYGVSKAALIHLVKSLTVEFSLITDKDIRINAVSPGYVYTDKSKGYLDSFKGQKLKERIPYKKFVLPIDVAHAVNFLKSDQSISMRGQNIVIDYGYTII